MNIIKVSNYEEMSDRAAEIIINFVRSNPQAKFGLATGSTPMGMYKRMIKDHKENGTTYQGVRTVNLDEYVGLSKDDRNSYSYFMKVNLFDYIDIPENQCFIPNGVAQDLKEECDRFEQLIQSIGGIDIQVLGIGPNGHIGFNEPGTPFTSRTHIVPLTESTRQANSRFFNSIDEVPKMAVTMGIETILQSKQIILLASGKEKAEAMKELINGEIDKSIPGSALKRHKNVTIIADEEALQFV